MKKVLIVDDSLTLREQIKGFLSDDYTCVTAVDGAAGLKAVLTEAPDAVIADIQMPKMDGRELLRAIRKNPPTALLPVLIVTTVMALDTVNECHALGCVGFVLKPVQKEYLLAKLRQMLKPR